MNLVELATELEYVPKDQLAQMSQDPSSRYPQYLVLSEIQRRTANEKAYAAARPQPTTPVAEEVVGEFMQPKGLQAGMPSESAPTDAFSSESMGIPASAPMQQPMMMAGGGLTAYANEGQTSLEQSFNDPFASLPQTGSSIMLPPDLQRQVLSLGIDTTGKSMNQIMAEVQAKGMTITNPPPPPPAPATDINKVLRLSETLDMGSVPDISYTPTEIPTSMTTPVPELPTELKDFKLSQREYNAPTEEDRQRELDVYGLGSLAKAFGTSKNLGEAGAEIGEAAMGISAIKKDQRKEMDRIESLKRTDEVQDFQVAGTKYGLESGRRKEQFNINKAILDIKQSDSQNEFNANLNLTKYANELKGAKLTLAKGLVNMEILREQVEATNNKTLGSLYNSISNEISDLEISEFNFDDTGKPKDTKARRYVQLVAQLQGIVSSLQKQGLLQETKPLYQGVN